MIVANLFRGRAHREHNLLRKIEPANPLEFYPP